MTDLSHFSTLIIHLSAIQRNYALISRQLKSGRAGAVVKANAYGLGAIQIAPVLYAAGCRDFFVATLEEAIEIRSLIADAALYVFHGVRKGQNKDFTTHNLLPVLNSAEQIDLWNNAGPAALHVDTGMCRLGVSLEELKSLKSKMQTPKLLMSHLACAGEPDHPKNKEQLTAFKVALQHFPGVPASLANSSGISLGADYHFDLTRPGRALYGITRGTTFPADMENVVTLSAPVLQYRTLDAPQTVGYGASVTAPAGSVLATVEMGYADGFRRSLSNKAHGYAGALRVPILGHVSMDMIVVDVTAVPAHLRTPDLRVTLIGKEQPIDVLAETAGTIGYEIFTGLGRRVKKIYES